MPDRVIRDPIYGYVTVPPSLVDFVDHALTQRLRRVGQTSLTSSVYPGATGTRFEHALGAMYLGRRACDAIWRNSTGRALRALKQRLNTELRRLTAAPVELGDEEDFRVSVQDAVGGVALLHDLGHPPFSHILEPLYRREADAWLDDRLRAHYRRVWSGQFHEAAGALLMSWLTEPAAERLKLLTRLIYEADPDDVTSAASVLHSIVAGEIDVDRLDYLMRDARKAGTEFGAIDYERLVDALQLGLPTDDTFRIAPTIRARSAAETVLIQRTQSYRWMIFHHQVVASNLALEKAVEVSLRLSTDESSLSLDGLETTADVLFGGVRPNLNYLTPETRSVRQLTRWDLAGRPGDVQDRVTHLVRPLLRASVDDSTILEWLKASAILAELLLERGSGIAAGTRESLRRLRVFSGVVLQRSKAFVPAWKSVEDFGKAVDVLVKDYGLADTIRNARNRVVEDVSTERAKDAVRALCREVCTLFEREERIAAVNLVAESLVSTRWGTERLVNALERSQLSGMPDGGFWEIAYTGFAAVRTEGHLAALYHPGQRQPIALIETSPMVRALQVAERDRPRLLAFFFFDGREIVTGELVRASFVEGFRTFVEEEWESYLRRFAGETD